MATRELTTRSPLLPVTYVEAKGALAKLQRVDECAKWANKAHALKSYAKQMKDESLANMAQRIKDRAIRKGGELLAQIKAQHGGDRKSKGRNPPIDRKAAANGAGLSAHQAKEMLRVAAVPEPEFEGMVEADKPASVTQLAQAGTKKQPKPKPWEHSDTWIEWVSAIEHLGKAPECGLDVLAEHDHRAHLKRECAAAIKNLRAWSRALEKAQ